MDRGGDDAVEVTFDHLPGAHLVRMNPVPRRDLLDGLAPSQCFQRYVNRPGFTGDSIL